MSNENELLIKINADAKNTKQAFDDVKEQTESLEKKLEGIAKISGVAFAALTAQVAIAVHEFTNADTASRKLSDSLQAQGIYTDDLKSSLSEYADAVSAITGVSKAQITLAQSVAQTYLGQIPVTKELTQAIVDLSVKQGIDLPNAAKELGLAIGNGTGMLLRQGLAFSSTATESQRFAQTMQFVTTYAGDAATALSPVTLATKRFEVAIEENQVALGERFAPAIATVIDTLTGFLKPTEDATGAMTDLKAILIITGIAISGIGVAVPLLAQAFLTVRAALIAANIQLGVTQVLLASLGIGLVIAGLVLLVTNFDKVKAAAVAAFTFLKEGFSGLGKIIGGVVTRDVEMIEAGVKQISGAWGASTESYKESLKKQEEASEKHEVKQDEVKRAAALRQQKIKNDQLAAAAQLQKEEDKLVSMQIRGASDEQIELEKQKIEALKLLSNKKNGDDKKILQERIAQITALQKQADEQELIRTEEFGKLELEAKKELAQQGAKFDEQMTQKEMNAIKKTELTKKQAEQKVFQDRLKDKIKENNAFLEEQAKYGTAYATLNKTIHSNEVTEIQKGTTELAALTQSKNATLKAIGKVAAIENIIIKTAQSAMNIYEGFSVIPFIGPALGIAGAAAAIAFGAEQIGNVTAAATGGLVQGPGYGDTQKYLLEPGEAVTPKKNYEEMINGVIQQRGFVKDDQKSGGSQMVAVNIGFDGRQAQQVLTANQTEAKALGTYRAKT